MAYDDAGRQLSQTASNLFDSAGRTESRTWYEDGDPGLPSRSLGEGCWQVSASILYAGENSATPRIGRISCLFCPGGGRAGRSHNGFLCQHLWWGERVAGSREAGFGERFEFFAGRALPTVRQSGRLMPCFHRKEAAGDGWV
jgi:hypothetical protein